ncbi:hypothetical protein IE53DRAFT_88776 [Violaceomyces palustris]|uniref:Uncharacterized protein n=1 Tax=Violaceomyces palustris TaxID=1673888 RepID=A0ACD0NXR0_9BASI|nr:hypothetical protein IE53DRAFT_88776 [Violaceomyces palustris]
MSVPSMTNITDSEFQREVEALKSHRRLSVNRPILDPDLPDLAAVRGGGQELLGISPASERIGVNLTDDGAVVTRSPSSSSQRDGKPLSTGGRSKFTARRRGLGAEATDSSSPDGTASTSSGGSGRRSPYRSGAASDPLRPQDPSHLFWVPASVHPEISPTDFRNFLKDHASRAVNQHALIAQADASDPSSSTGDSADASALAKKIGSARRQADANGSSPSDLISRSTSLTRRGSTLRRQYRPENDTDDDSDSPRPLPLHRQKSNLASSIPALTIDDLQKLEQLAEEASRSQDPTRLRSVLRRTLSLNVSPSALDQVDDMPPDTDDADSPIIVPRPGQILRRAARTKIRKSSMSSENGTRPAFGQRRRGTNSPYDSDSASEGGSTTVSADPSVEPSQTLMERRQSNQSEISSGAEEDSSYGGSSRPVSDEATESIVDAYSRDSFLSDASHRTSLTSFGGSPPESAGTQLKSPSRSPSPPVTPTQSSVNPSGQRGYFDIRREAKEGPSHVQPREPIFDSPITSPDQEKRPSAESSSNQIKPIPISHIPPIPSFEKTRPTPPLQMPPSKSSSTTASSGLTAQTATNNVAAQPVSAPNSSPAFQQTKDRTHLGPPQGSRPRPVSPPPPARSKEKEKKGGFGLSWFGLGKDEDESDREKATKAEKEKEKKKEKHERRERKERERDDDREREKSERDSSSFLGALFGSKKKGQDEGLSAAPRHVNGQITAGSLLDRSAAGAYGKGPLTYYRYPIHIERAVYRLSHIKLANPRRPLYEQVLISNLMFWYLSIINRSQQQQQQQQIQAAQQAQAQAQAHNPGKDDALVFSSPQTAGGAAAATAAGVPSSVIETPRNAIDARPEGLSPAIGPVSEQGESASGPSDRSQHPGPNHPSPSSTKSKKGALVKPDRAPSGSKSKGRSAEILMKQPGYVMQHQQIDDDMKEMITNQATSDHYQQINMQHQQQIYGPSATSVGITPQAPQIAVGQVVDAQVLQVNSPYQFHPNGSSPAHYQVPTRSASTPDYLGLDSLTSPSESLWPEAETPDQSLYQQKKSPALSSQRSNGREREKELESGNWMGGGRRSPNGSSSGAPVSAVQGSGSSANRRVDADAERAWLGAPRSSIGNRSPSPNSQRMSDPSGDSRRSNNLGGAGHSYKSPTEWDHPSKSDRTSEPVAYSYMQRDGFFDSESASSASSRANEGGADDRGTRSLSGPRRAANATSSHGPEGSKVRPGPSSTSSSTNSRRSGSASGSSSRDEEGVQGMSGGAYEGGRHQRRGNSSGSGSGYGHRSVSGPLNGSANIDESRGERQRVRSGSSSDHASHLVGESARQTDGGSSTPTPSSHGNAPGFGGLSTSKSLSIGKDGLAGVFGLEKGVVEVPPGTQAMLEAARTSQSRRR